ncbi:MAG: FtsX-like permease family protein [Thermodesulfovibrionales bacterium]
MTRSFTLFSLALRNIRRKPLRTAMLVASICLLTSALVFGLSFTRRVQTSIRVATERLGADLLVVPAGSRGAADDILLENVSKTFFMDSAYLQKVQAIPGVKTVTAQTYLQSLGGRCCDVPETTVVAFNQDTDFIVTPWLQKKLGRRLQKGEGVVGHESAMNLSVELVDTSSMLFGNKFTMVGVLEKTGTGLDTAIFVSDENIADILEKGQTGLKPGQVSILFVKVKDGVDPSAVASEVENTMVELDAVARKDVGKGILSTLRDINAIFLTTVLLVSVLSVFLVWTVFSAVVSERAREIGIMRAVGARDSHVSRLFIAEVVSIGLAGSLVGVILGTGASVLLSKTFSMLKGLPTDLPVLQRMVIAVFCLCAGTGICVLGALSPIRRMKQLEPLSVMKEN